MIWSVQCFWKSTLRASQSTSVSVSLSDCAAFHAQAILFRRHAEHLEKVLSQYYVSQFCFVSRWAVTDSLPGLRLLCVSLRDIHLSALQL